MSGQDHDRGKSQYYEPDKLESDTAKAWVQWCQTHPLVKCVEYQVPDGILPKNFKGTLIDVKIQGKGKWSGPDDKIYCAHADLRAKVARGNCVLELQHPTKCGDSQRSTSYLFLVFALKKFSGGMGDEDDCESQNLWQNYFIKSIEEADKIVATQKANGEAAHIACRKIGDQNFFCIGSKNVHLLARNKADVERYPEGRFNVAGIVARTFFSNYVETSNVELNGKREDFIEYLDKSKCTCVFELLQPAYQHIEDLSYLDSPELRFICWTEMYSDKDFDSLCSIPPNLAIDRAKSFGLDAIDYEIIPASEAESYMLKIRSEKDYEGKVLYFMDEKENVFGIIKKKTAWYIILRAIREKSSTVTSPKNNWSRSEMEKKLTKRIVQIQEWLGFSDHFRQQWTELAIGFANWIVDLAKRNSNNSPGVRHRFPILWKEYLASNEKHETLYKNLQYS